MSISEFRTYGFILDALASLGWNKSSPAKGGQVYTQNEIQHDEDLKSVLGLRRPENVVVVDNNPRQYWVIEAKADIKAMRKALKQAKELAELINRIEPMICRLVTGIAGDPDSTHLIETHFMVSPDEWEPVTINGRQATGFVSPGQVSEILVSESSSIDEYEIDEELFLDKTQQINKILHDGGINKRNRAAVLASLLLAIAFDPRFKVHGDLRTMIGDINTRARRYLKRYKKDEFFGEIEIHLPTSDDNHHKHKTALNATIDVLRGLNIASAINSGRDVLGEFYEQFLKYANDASELGIVLTPRHITTFAANVVDVRPNNVIFDPACGTGGFLVAALDKVRRDIGDVTQFKKGNLHGIEQDPLIATLAIVNMIFRGDGSSNIQEGDGLVTQPSCQPDCCLLNPPFALEDEYEWKFVDKALGVMTGGGLLFAIVPTTTMMSAGDDRLEKHWRNEMLMKHTLLAVITMPQDLFYPHVSKGTYGILIRAHQPHDVINGKVFWAILSDGKNRTKTARALLGNLKEIEIALRNFVATGTESDCIPGQMDCAPIRKAPDGFLDLSPENHIGREAGEGNFDMFFLADQRQAAHCRIQRAKSPGVRVETGCRSFQLMKFVEWYEKGRSNRVRDLPLGTLPVVSTSETDNGISDTVDRDSAGKVYSAGLITISSNGGSCCAFFHDYEFGANPDVWVLSLKDKFADPSFSVFLCAAINNESWRYNYYRKFNLTQLKSLTIQMPINGRGNLDFRRIRKLAKDAGLTG